MLNQLIMRIADAGLSEIVYYAFHGLGFAAILLFNLWYCKFYGIKKSQAVILTCCTYIIAYLWVYCLAWVENRFSYWGSNNIVRAFVWFPLIAMIPNHFLKIDRRKMTDLIAPCCALVQAVSHIGCIFAGCCNGYVCDRGIYNPVSTLRVFPVQLLESAVAAIIVVFLIRLAKKEAYVGSGKIFPAFLISFGGTRFFLEFLRANEKVVGPVSVLALHAALMVIVGSFWLMIDFKRKAKAQTVRDC